MKKNINLEIGERVRLTRVSRGFTRDELAEILNISTLFLGYIECGQRGMSLTTLQNMCKILNVSADYLLLGKEKEGTVDDEIISAVKDLPDDYKSLALDAVNNLKKTIAQVTRIAYKNEFNEKR